MRFSCLISFFLYSFSHSVLYFKRIILEKANFHIFSFPFFFFKSSTAAWMTFYLITFYTFLNSTHLYYYALAIKQQSELNSNIPLSRFSIYISFIAIQSCSCRKMQLKIEKILFFSSSSSIAIIESFIPFLFIAIYFFKSDFDCILGCFLKLLELIHTSGVYRNFQGEEGNSNIFGIFHKLILANWIKISLI